VNRMRTAVVLFTRDLRVHDHPALATACANAERVVPLFVLDPALAGVSPNRDRFLAESLRDLRASLRRRGGDLVVRRGDPVAETLRVARTVGAEGIAVTGDVTRYAQRRQRRLRAEGERHRISVRVFAGNTIVAPGAVTPAGGGDHYRVFTPYLRAWHDAGWREELATPARITLPDAAVPVDGWASASTALDLLGTSPPGAVTGGEGAGRTALRSWLDRLADYERRRDDLATAGVTSGLSPYLRFGCLSPLSVARVALRDGSAGAQAFVRQLCWRDFYHQLTRAFPELGRSAYRRGAGEDWRDDPDALAAWAGGHTGVPVVDAAMRQLRAEGWLPNRARMITASFLCAHVGADWRAGAAEFHRWLLDGEVPSNCGNWQWTAGTGTDQNPYRRFNPVRQALRFDPDGAYVRRFVPELAGVPGPAVHQPWRLPAVRRAALRYPPPLDPRRGDAVWLRP